MTNRPPDGESSSLSLYLRELGRIPRLSPEEEQECARLASQGDETARQRLIRANLRFVIMVARQYRNRGVPLEDLVNEGNIGLLQAAARFDPDRGIRFVSYAVHWIRQGILKAIHENGSLIRVPRSSSRKSSWILAQAARRTVSLDSPVAGREDDDPFGACLEDRSVPKPEEVLVGASLNDELGSLLAGLSDREASIIRDRFGLAGSRRTSLLDVGRKHGLSKERVRQIEKKILRKIRVSGCDRQLEAYVN